MIHLTINDEARELAEGTNVRVLLEQLGQYRPGIAVARNLEVVPKTRWEVTEFVEGDRVDIVEAVGGG